MTSDYLELARRRLADLRRTDTVTAFVRAADCEKSEISEESPPGPGVISHISLISQSVPVPAGADDPLVRARRLREQQCGKSNTTRCEISEKSELSPQQVAGRAPGPRLADTDREVGEQSEESATVPPLQVSGPSPALLADPFRAWRLRNAERLSEVDRRLGHDAGGFCAEHNRWLTYPEQRRGACSSCLPVDPNREPEYWASHWRRFAEHRKDGRG